MSDIIASNLSQNLPVPATIFDAETIKNELSQFGLDGLKFDFASFPTITLQGKSFILSDDADFDLKSFDVTILKTAQKHILVDAKDVNFDGIKYSIDGISTTDGEPLQAFIDSMLHDGRSPAVKRYLDVMCQLHTEDKHNGKLVVLSISPTSVSKISGFFCQLKIMNKLDSLREMRIRVSKGQQRTSRNGQVYFLWSFELVEEVAAA